MKHVASLTDLTIRRALLVFLLVALALQVIMGVVQAVDIYYWGYRILVTVITLPTIFAISEHASVNTRRLFWWLLLGYAVLYLAYRGLFYYTARWDTDNALHEHLLWNLVNTD